MAIRYGGKWRTADRKVDDWMRTHTVHDFEDLVRELSSKGEDVSETAKAVGELEEMVEEEHEWERQHTEKEKGEGQTA